MKRTTAVTLTKKALRITAMGDPQYAAKFAASLNGDLIKKAILSGDEKKAWSGISTLAGNLKTLIALLDGGTAEPKEVALLSRMRKLLDQRRPGRRGGGMH